MRDQADGATLAEDIDAKTTEPTVGKREVHFQLLSELLPLPLAHDGLSQTFQIRRGKDRLPNRLDNALDAIHRWAVLGEVNIRSVTFSHECEKIADVHSTPPSSLTKTFLWGFCQGEQPERTGLLSCSWFVLPRG